eukprot:4811677-Ditylum_brightwellii.AAC.1
MLVRQSSWSLMSTTLGEDKTPHVSWNFSGCSPIRLLNKPIALQAQLQGWTPCEERRHIFKACPFHSWGGKLQGLLCDWAMLKATLNGAILMWHMGSHEKKVSAINLPQTCYFPHLKYRDQKFRYLQNLITSVERAAMMKDTWMNDGWMRRL